MCDIYVIYTCVCVISIFTSYFCGTCCAGGYSGWDDAAGVTMDSKKDCITHPGWATVLCVAWRNDNLGVCVCVGGGSASMRKSM